MKKPVFVVHEHHSKRLHYDFRLEMAGVLKSWAVPKGPSMDPKDKRLAVMVDDHPLEYGSFEGIIPEGSYGAGEVVIWDKGGFELSGGDLKRGAIEFTLSGAILKGAFALVKMKGRGPDNWLLMKKADSFARKGFEVESALTPEKKNSLREKTPPCEAS